MSEPMSDSASPTDTLAEIENRLRAATPGQWKMLDGWGPVAADGRYRAARIGTDDAPVFSPSGPYGAHDIIARKEDFEFVAYAAQDIAWLVSAVKQLRAIVEMQGRALQGATAELGLIGEDDDET